MNGLPYYKAYPRDFIEGTIGMPFDLKAAYRLVLDLIYMQGGKLPDDPRYISGLLGCSVRAWKGYREQLLSLGKIHTENGIISNFRADKELETSGSFQEKQRENRSRTNKNNSLRSPKPDHTDTDTDTDTEDVSLRSTSNARERALSEFDQWYRHYPHKVQRGAAEKAFPKARKSASLQELIDGVHRYIDSKPADRPYQNPATWLNGKGWLDQPANAQPRASPSKLMTASQLANYLSQDHDDGRQTTPTENHLRLAGPLRTVG